MNVRGKMRETGLRSVASSVATDVNFLVFIILLWLCKLLTSGTWMKGIHEDFVLFLQFSVSLE